MIQIDLQSRVPLYEQLQEQIIRLSMLGILDENQQLPSVRALAREYGVSKSTVHKDMESRLAALPKLISSWSNRASSTPYREGEALFHRMSFPCNRCGRQPCRRFWTLWTRR